MGRIRFLGWIAVFTAGPFAVAATPNPFKVVKPPPVHSYPAQKLSVKGLREIRIVGVKGQLRLEGRSQMSHLQLRVRHSANRRFDDWQLSMDRRDNILYLEVFNLVHGRQWRQQVQENAWPEFDIELKGPSLPVMVSWREGDLTVQHWSSPVDIQFFRGQANIAGGSGDLNIQTLEADVKVESRLGQVKVRGESGSLEIAGVSGGVDVSWLKGKIDVRECKGVTRIESRAGQLQVNGGQGELRAKLEEGQGRIRGFKGVVLASGERAAWHVQAVAPSDLNVTTSSGSVNVDWTGGARVFLTTTDGQVRAGSSFKSFERDGRKIVAGYTKSARGTDRKMKGEVFVRTQSGRIDWREAERH